MAHQHMFEIADNDLSVDCTYAVVKYQVNEYFETHRKNDYISF